MDEGVSLKNSMLNSKVSLAQLFDQGTADCGDGSGNAGIFYSSPVEGLEVPGVAPIYRLLLAIWQLRSADLQKSHPLSTPEGRVGFLAWCAVHGRREYAALRDFSPLWRDLAQPALIPTTAWSGGISRFMQLVARARADLGIDPELASETDQLALLRWFWFVGGHRELECTSENFGTWQKDFFFNHRDLAETRFALLTYAFHPELQRAFPLHGPAGKNAFGQWLVRHGVNEKGLKELILAMRGLSEYAAVTIAQDNGRQWHESGERRPGVNLIGYAHGELGIGEDVRMAAHALHAAGVPFTVINFAPGDDIRQEDHSIAQWVGEKPLYAVNIFCVTALEHLRFVMECGSKLLAGRYNIGYWPWELESWPADWKHCLHLVDEVWTSSEYTRQSVVPVSRVPVLTMPMAVSLPEVRSVQRSKYQLPNDAVLFVFSFDGKSSLARKNPLAVVAAFQAAFDEGNEAVGLVIKCMRPDKSNAAWKRIVAAAKADARIRIVDAVLDKAEVLGLYRACDCFVSLHRAEGYGRGIAEALLLGLDVIATNYGGNVDFCREAGAHLVPCEPIPVRRNEYAESAGQRWAEPDVAAASDLMRKVAEGRQANRKPAQAAVLSRLFSPGAIGRRYRQRLTKLGLLEESQHPLDLNCCV